jgi:tRNA A-37 threonylcarbamoyl transferase component Bud32
LTGNPINFGNVSGPTLKSALAALFPGSKPQNASSLQRPGTSSLLLRSRREEERKEKPSVFSNFSAFPGPSVSGHLGVGLSSGVNYQGFASTNSFDRVEKLERVERSERSDLRGNLSGVTQVDYTEVTLGEIISQGGFSVVHKAQWKGARVAAKVIVDPVITADLRAEFENEIQMLNYLRHPNTVLLMAASFKPPHFTMISEFVPNGTLFDYLHRSREEISIDRKVSIIIQISSVFLFYHNSGVVHRDLKTMNVLLSEGQSIKICDFGLARFKADLNKGSMQFSGTPAYMAPELFKKQSYDEKVDVFAFGTVVWEVLTRQVPFDALEPGDIRDRVLRGDLRLDNPVVAPRKLVSLIDMCRRPNPGERPGFEEISQYLANM